MRFVLAFFVLLMFAVSSLKLWLWSDNSRATKVWRELADKNTSTVRFEPSMIAELPEPVRRYFLHTIKIGAPIYTVVEIRMNGELGLGTKDKPNYLPMVAEQLLAPPHGFVWKLRAGEGLMQLNGSDGFDGETSWVCFWLAKLLPVVRQGGSADHARAAFGRVVAEAAFWAPASLLPQFGVSWQALDDNSARATMTSNGMTQTVDITITDEGRPIKVVIPRWTDANAEKEFRLQPFGGYLSEFRDFEGYTLPTRVEGGNWIDTDDYFPFYKVEVEDLQFVDRNQ
jgi:hypothetical protein